MVCLWYNVIQVVKKQFERNAGEKNMKKILDLITGEVTQAFVDCGYDAKYGKVTLSNRPDLCEYQCNGAMAAAKEYKKAPFMIADEVAEKLSGNAMFSMVESVKPGFLNLKLDEAYLADYVAKMQADEGRYGCEKTKEPKTIMIDYGGPNVAKPLRRTSALGDYRREHQAHRTFYGTYGNRRCASGRLGLTDGTYHHGASGEKAGSGIF